MPQGSPFYRYGTSPGDKSGVMTRRRPYGEYP
jgi:hypothetical protein